MKRIKKLASLLLAMVMAFAMTITAFATEPDSTQTPDGTEGNDSYTITIKGKTSGHTYQAYQVFMGDLMGTGTEDSNGNPEYKLSNIRWADGVNLTETVDGKDLMTALREMARFADVKDAADVAEKLSNNSTAEDTQAFSDIIAKYLGTPVSGYFTEGISNGTVYPYTMTVTSPGYYFVRDAVDPNGTGTDAEGTASYTDYILQVVGNVSVNSKDTTVEIDKDILDPDPVKTNTAGIGDDVTYRLTSKVPNYTAYKSYYFIMQDNLSDGLTFNNDVEVSIGTIGSDGKFTVDEGLTEKVEYAIYAGADDTLLEDGAATDAKTFKIAFIDIKSLGTEAIGKDIVVTYSAKINENAVIGSTGNKNDIRLIYSNNPNNSGSGDPEDEDEKPGIPDSDKNIPTGTTPESVVVTFVADVNIYKTRPEGEGFVPLPGAEFTLTGFSTQTVLTGKEVYTPSINGTYYQLKDGTYTTDAPTVEATMQALPASATAGYVEAETDYTGQDAVVVGGKTYRPYKENDNGTVYILIEPNNTEYASVTVKFTKTDATETTTTTKYVSAVGTSDEKGKVTFKTSDGKPLGLGEGTYTITETKTPEGYNTVDPITIVISGTVTIDGGKVTGSETCTWSYNGSSINSIIITNKEQMNGNMANPGEDPTGGSYWMNIINRSGSLLPSTGGIGTTIFYVVGGILVIGAGILLVAKKRMGKR